MSKVIVTSLDQFNSAFNKSVVAQHTEHVDSIIKSAALEKVTYFSTILLKGIKHLEQIKGELNAIKPDIEAVVSAEGEEITGAAYKKSTANKRSTLISKLKLLDQLVFDCMNIKPDEEYSKLEEAYNKLSKKVSN